MLDKLLNLGPYIAPNVNQGACTGTVVSVLNILRYLTKLSNGCEVYVYTEGNGILRFLQENNGEKPFFTRKV